MSAKVDKTLKHPNPRGTSGSLWEPAETFEDLRKHQENPTKNRQNLKTSRSPRRKISRSPPLGGDPGPEGEVSPRTAASRGKNKKDTSTNFRRSARTSWTQTSDVLIFSVRGPWKSRSLPWERFVVLHRFFDGPGALRGPQEARSSTRTPEVPTLSPGPGPSWGPKRPTAAKASRRDFFASISAQDGSRTPSRVQTHHFLALGAAAQAAAPHSAPSPRR